MLPASLVSPFSATATATATGAGAGAAVDDATAGISVGGVSGDVENSGGAVATTPAGVVAGALPVCTVHVRVAGVGSALPTASTARTANVWPPLLSPISDVGGEHAAQAPPSRLHSNVAACSDVENASCATV